MTSDKDLSREETLAVGYSDNEKRIIALWGMDFVKLGIQHEREKWEAEKLLKFLDYVMDVDHRFSLMQFGPQYPTKESIVKWFLEQEAE
jgi:hypothetical protein